MKTEMRAGNTWPILPTQYFRLVNENPTVTSNKYESWGQPASVLNPNGDFWEKDGWGNSAWLQFQLTYSFKVTRYSIKVLTNHTD